MHRCAQKKYCYDKKIKGGTWRASGEIWSHSRKVWPGDVKRFEHTNMWHSWWIDSEELCSAIIPASHHYGRSKWPHWAVQSVCVNVHRNSVCQMLQKILFHFNIVAIWWYPPIYLHLIFLLFSSICVLSRCQHKGLSHSTPPATVAVPCPRAIGFVVYENIKTRFP